MEDPPPIVPLKRSRSPSPVELPTPYKRSKVEKVPETETEKSSTSPLFHWSDNQNDSNSSSTSDSSTSHSNAETEENTRGPSPVNVVAVDFDSVIAASVDSEQEDEEVEAVDLNATIELSEESESQSESSAEEEIEVIKEKEKPKPESKRNRRKGVNQRRNIKELIGQDSLDVATLAAQKEEWARRERMAAKQKSLGMSSLPLSMEQIMERFSSASSVVSLTHVGGSSDGDKKKTAASSSSSRVQQPKSPVEDEVVVLSSDEEDIIPCYESKSTSQTQQMKSTKEGGPPALLPLSKLFATYGSDSTSNRSRYSGGTMIINHQGADVKFDEDEIDESLKSTEELQDEDSDDDCIVLSPPPPDAADEAEKDEDAFNVPDELGRVLVNVGHPADEPDIFLSPQIARAVKPHQIGGIRFMYDNVVESIERYNNSPGFGCILAHSMGLGKTIQAAAFCDIFLNHTGANKVLVIVPINTIQNWLNEFNYWLPGAKVCSEPAEPTRAGKKRGRKVKTEAAVEKLEVDESSSQPPVSPAETSHSSADDGDDEASKSALKPEETYSRNFEIFVLNETVKNLAARGKIISEWSERRGVLLIGYEMYRMLALKKLRKTGKRKKSFIDLQQEDKTALEEETTLDKIYSCLVDPGPDLVICDEGHKIKNSGASISQALKAIRTRRRIVLTGYPLQNNLMEYHCMCDFIRPNYLGTKAEFGNMFERPIINGQCIDSTVQDKRLMQFRSHVLHSLVEGFVQRRSHLVLQRALPRKEEWVFLVKMSPIQTRLYKEFILFIRHQADLGNSPPNPIKAFAICCKIWNHPDVLYNVVAKKEKVNEQAVLEDLEDLAEEVQSLNLKKKRGGGGRKRSDLSSNSSVADGVQQDDDWEASAPLRGIGKEKDISESALSFDWSLEAFKGYVPNVLENGTKFELLFTIIEETVKVGDKLLIFSQSLLTLNLMEIFIGMKLGWMKGKEYFRLDGSTTGLERERLIKEFNKTPEIHVFLVSTRAGSLGINLIGANRVVVFDASWNPCHDCQAVCRIYRYGQKKRCQIYRFVTDCSLEKKIYDRQITKRGMANRVVDEMNPDAHISTKDLSGSLLLELDDLMALQDLKVDHDASEFDDPVVQRLLTVGGDKITKAPFEHESLLIDRKEKKLSKAERRLALRNYELEKKSTLNQTLTPTGRVSHAAYMQNNYARSEYDAQVNVRTIAPATLRPRCNGTTLKAGFKSGFAGSPIFRNDANLMNGKQSAQRFPRPMNSVFGRNDPFATLQLKKNGISAQVIVLRKDSFLPDPSGTAPDIYLRSGQKVCLIRTTRGAYLKLDNGKMVAVRDRLRGAAQTILDTVPSSQDLTKDQASIIIHSILRPRISSIISAQPPIPQPKRQLTRNRVFPQTLAQKSNTKPTAKSSQAAAAPSSVEKIPPPAAASSAVSKSVSPSFTYNDFQNQNQHNLQITNHRNSSGGDVTIWRKDNATSSSSTSTRSESISGGSTMEEGVPDIELIKINPNGENQRIEPTQLESELMGNANTQQPQVDSEVHDRPQLSQLDPEIHRNTQLVQSQIDPEIHRSTQLVQLDSELQQQHRNPIPNPHGPLDSDLLRNQQVHLGSDYYRNHHQEQPDYYSSYPPYMGSGLDSSPAMYPPVNDVSTLMDALGRSPMNSSKYKDQYYPPPPQLPPMPTQSYNSLRPNNSQHYRNTDSPLDHLRNTVSQIPPSYKYSDDLAMDYSAYPPVHSHYPPNHPQQQPRNSIPESLYSKLLQSQEAMSMVPPPPYNPHHPMRSPESSMYAPPSQYYGSHSHNFYDSSASMYSKQGYGGMSQGNSYPYFTNGGSVSVNEKPAKSIFTPVEQEILDRHRRELL